MKKIPTKHTMYLYHDTTNDLDQMLETFSAGEKTLKKALLAKEDAERQFRCDMNTPPPHDIYEVTITFKKVKL